MAFHKYSAFCLMDLPDELLETILDCLSSADRKCFMATCRRAACTTLRTAKQVTLRITEASKAAGIIRVLNIFPANIHLDIKCPHDLYDQELHDAPLSAQPAVNMFMATVPQQLIALVASRCRWEGITKVTIQGVLLRCLVPHFIAITCPQLACLEVVRLTNYGKGYKPLFTEDVEDALPLAVCSSLRELSFCTLEDHVHLPPEYHSPEELRHNLPNIESLFLGGPGGADLITAVAPQLEWLDTMECHEEDHHAIRQCSQLTHLGCVDLILPDNTAQLKSIDMQFTDCSDDDMKQLLQLPKLTTLRLGGVSNVSKDWSCHACPWHALRIDELEEFTSLANLSLSTVKKLRIGPDAVIRLPDPRLPNSLQAVQRVVDNLSNVGKAVFHNHGINASSNFGQCGAISWEIDYMQSDSDSEESDNDREESDIDYDAEAAQLITMAAQRLGPVKTCVCNQILHLPQCLRAVVNWGCSFIESVCFGHNYDLEPYVWEALHQLPKLRTVVFWAAVGEDDEENGDHAETLLLIPDIISSVVQKYVIPANKKLRIEFGVRDADEYHYGHDKEKTRNYYHYMQIKGQEHLRTAIPKALPPGSKCSSIQFCCVKGNSLYNHYGVECITNKFWVVVVQPSQSAR